MKRKNKEYLLWWQKALDDLKWTEANIREKIYYGACFTAQQSTEKALKAYLIFKKGRFGKIHDLVSLLGYCSRINRNFISFRKDVAKISHYYVQSRYPDIGDLNPFSGADAQEAFEIASEMIEFIRKQIKK